MAVYEFGCGACEAVVEKRQSFDDPPPTCCDMEMERLVSLPSRPVFMGPGTYATDYGNQPHNLKAPDQRLRARREWHERDLMVARPGLTNPIEAKKIKEMSERGKYV